MRTAKVTLGGVEYEIQQLPIKQSREWRDQLRGPFSGLVGVLESAGQIRMDSGRDLGGLIRSMETVLLGSVDLIIDLLYKYSTVISHDRQRIEETATDDEAVAAFTEVIKLAYPLGKLRAELSGLLT